MRAAIVNSVVAGVETQLVAIDGAAPARISTVVPEDVVEDGA